MRLQKYMAACGVASRRKSENLILDGRVKVNGQLVNELGSQIDPFIDKIEVDGRILEKPGLVYLFLNKPKGVVTTVKDTHDRPCVMDLFPQIPGLHPVGRLDMDTEGLLLLTNDGELTFLLTHPKHEFTKTYQGWVEGCPSERALQEFAKGMQIENYQTSPAKIRILASQKGRTLLEMIIHEGKKRQIRKMCQAMGTPIISLKRTAIGKLELGTLKSGESRRLKEEEVNYLKEINKW
ncbi:pseudouridine synthase [Eubacteriaceae bacterium ES3]|nr:pseudouridine synthase [Eubacteriaceae bacterium ES3]